MFKIGDILRVNLAVAQQQFADYKDTQPYHKMMEAAEKHRYEVVGETSKEYQLKRIEDNQPYVSPKSEVHSNFVIAQD